MYQYQPYYFFVMLGEATAKYNLDSLFKVAPHQMFFTTPEKSNLTHGHKLLEIKELLYHLKLL